MFFGSASFLRTASVICLISLSTSSRTSLSRRGSLSQRGTRRNRKKGAMPSLSWRSINSASVGGFLSISLRSCGEVVAAEFHLELHRVPELRGGGRFLEQPAILVDAILG